MRKMFSWDNPGFKGETRRIGAQGEEMLGLQHHTSAAFGVLADHVAVDAALLEIVVAL